MLTAGVDELFGLGAVETTEECDAAEPDGTASLEVSGTVFSDEADETGLSTADCV